jgi:CDGSH-type Zn-finger protein
MGNNEKKIKIVKDGPYLVSGSLPLGKDIEVIGSDGEPEKWAKGESLPLKENYALCRCGRSAAKPFCDGTHIKTGFNGTETAQRKNFKDIAEKNPGPGVDLHDAECFCSIAMFCHRAGDAWNLTEKSDDPACKKIAVEEACDCPSGRLVAYDKQTGEPIEPAFEPSIGLVEDTKKNVSGPLWVKGRVPIVSSDGFQYEVRNRMTLCRCGNSSNKPFCDGSHIDTKFNDGHAFTGKIKT